MNENILIIQSGDYRLTVYLETAGMTMEQRVQTVVAPSGRLKYDWIVCDDNEREYNRLVRCLNRAAGIIDAFGPEKGSNDEYE